MDNNYEEKPYLDIRNQFLAISIRWFYVSWRDRVLPFWVSSDGGSHGHGPRCINPGIKDLWGQFDIV